MNILIELTKVRGRVESDSVVTRPLWEAIRMTILALGIALLTVIVGPNDFFSAAHERYFYPLLLFTILPVGSIAFAYAFLGSRVGRRRASVIVKVAIGAVVLPVLIVFAVRTLIGL